MVKLPAKVTVTLPTAILPVHTVPFGVIVILLFKAIVPVPVTVYPPVPKLNDVPDKARFALKFSVPVKPVKFKFAQREVTFTVAVPDPLDALKKTLSTDVGTDAPEPPPDVADQLVVEL